MNVFQNLRARSGSMSIARSRLRLGSLVTAVLALSVGWAASSACAQGFPNKPITIVVPFPAGNASDVAARAVGEELGRKLGQPVVVENKTGATGTIGASFVAKSAPDGHTLLMTSTSFAISTALVANLPYRPMQDFEPVFQVGGSGGMLLIVAPDFPAKSVGEFIDLARRNPGKYNYAHVGRGTIQHLTMEVFLAMTGLQIQPVAYKGSVQAITDIISGQIQVMFDSPSSSASFVDSGKVKALVSAADGRSVRLPNVPAVPESGLNELRDFRVGGWVGLLAPAKTPQAVIARLNEEVGAIVNAPAMKQRLLQGGLEVTPPHSPQQFGRFLEADMARWQTAATAAKIPKE
jgi:tripartite-type tricarboxylate transporter receptor subunit TctC